MTESTRTLKPSDRRLRQLFSQLRPNTLDAYLSLLAWILILVTLWQLSMIPAAPGYELSIYGALPSTFLYAIQAALALHVFVAARASFRLDRDRASGLAAISSIIGVVFTVAVALSLPQLRGYFSLTGDFASHIARSAEITSTANIGKDVFYPALYSLVQVVHAATGLDSSVIWFFGGAGSYVLYILLCIMAAGRLLNDSRAGLIAGLAAAIPVAGAYLRNMAPAGVSVHLLPLLFYLYARSRRREGQGFNLLLVLLLVLYPFLHPLTSLLAVLWLALIEVARWALSRAAFWRQGADSSRTRPALNPVPLALTTTLILGITWITWLSSFALWNNSVREVADWLAGEARTQLATIDYLAGRTGLSTLELAEVVFKQESGVIVYTGLALASMPLFFFLVGKGRVGTRLVQYLTPLYAWLIVSALAAGFAVVGPMGGIDFYRFARFLVPWGALILAAAPMLISLLRPPSHLAVSTLVILAFIVVALGGFRALYPSPWVFQPNDQMTLQDMDCMNWVYNIGDGRDIRGVWSLERLADRALGRDTARVLPSMWRPVPDHFGYDLASSISQTLIEPAYVLITEYDLATVLDLWASVGKYTEEDFRRLETDRAAVLLYANGGCEIWGSGATEQENAQ